MKKWDKYNAKAKLINKIKIKKTKTNKLLARKQRKTWKMGTKGQRSALLMTC
jgi:hypothetical protein